MQSHIYPTFAFMLAALLSSVAAPAADNAEKPATNSPAASQPSAATAVKVALSNDGFKFEPTGDVFLRSAAAPQLIRLPKGDLLAVFEYAGPAASAGKPSLWATRSKDDGKSWLPPRPIQLEGLPDDADKMQIARPELIVMPNGMVRLFCCASETETSRRKREKTATYILTATTRNGLTYQLEQRAIVECPGVESARPAAFWAAKQMVLLVAGESESKSGQTARSGMVQQFLSTDGRTFSRPDRAKLAGEVGHVLRIDEHHYRMYITDGTEIHSRMSNDGIRWRDEAGVCLQNGSAAAVAPLGGKKYLMLYCAAGGGSKDAKAPELAASPPVGEGEDGGRPGSPTSANTSATDRKGWDSFDLDHTSDELAAVAAPGDASDLDARCPPFPDFINHFDYRGWFEQNLPPADQNAYYAYGDPQSFAEIAWAALPHMLNSQTHAGPPVPWSPSDHPDWEATSQQIQQYLPQFKAGATSSLDYGTPIRFPENMPAEDQLLVNMTLPGLSGFRQMTKATLADAWRAPDGAVSPDTMREAFEVCLGNAHQLSSGACLIERLVGFAERNLVNEHARWALRHNVFSTPDQLEATLNLLKQKDLPITDPAGWITMEQAWVREAAQYVFKLGENGKPATVDAERLKKLAALAQGTTPDKVELTTELLNTTTEQAKETLTEIDAYYRYMDQVWSSSFPGPAIDNTDKLAQEIRERDPVAGSVLASGHRAYEMMMRAEAGRRATQLVYGVELFKARNGRYPTTLDELPAEHVTDVRTDPFSTRDFVYRLTDSGPLIYSTSNNGSDDGGVHSNNWGNREDGTQSDDYVFWPPQD